MVWASNLADLGAADDETIDQAILPYLKSMKSRAELQDYLTVRLRGRTATQ